MKFVFRFRIHIFDFIQQKKTKFTIKQPYMSLILYCQYHACWCPGDISCQVTSRHGIGQTRQNIQSLRWKELILDFALGVDQMIQYLTGKQHNIIQVGQVCQILPHLELILLWRVVSPMMTSSNGSISRVTGPLCGEFTSDWRIPRTKASDAKLWCFL